MQRMTLESSLTLCISRSRRARNHGLRPFQGRQQGDFAFHENISRHGNHEGLIVDESAGHTAGARANRASMSCSPGHGVIIRECSGRVLTSQERCRGSGFGRRSGPHTVLSSGYGPSVGN